MSESAYDTSLALADALEEHGVPYAIGGALAYGVWGVPRATMDVDVNVFVTEKQLTPTLEAIRGIGGRVDTEQAEIGAKLNGMFVAQHGPFRIDVFTSSIPFCDEAARTRVRVPVDGREVWYLSAESLAVFKMMFFRPKDIGDLQNLLAVRGTDFDTAYVRAQLVDMVGPDDARIVRWDALSERARTPAEEYEVETPLVVRGTKAFTVLRKADGSTSEHEISRSALGTLRRGDRVRVSAGSIAIISPSRDLDRGR